MSAKLRKRAACFTNYLNLGCLEKPLLISGPVHVFIFRLHTPHGEVYVNMWGEVHVSENHCFPCDPQKNQCWSINRVIESGIVPSLVLNEGSHDPHTNSDHTLRSSIIRAPRKYMSNINRVAVRSGIKAHDLYDPAAPFALRTSAFHGGKIKVIETDVRFMPMYLLVTRDRTDEFLHLFPHYQPIILADSINDSWDQGVAWQRHLWSEIKSHYNVSNLSDVVNSDICSMFTYLCQPLFPHVDVNVMLYLFEKMLAIYAPVFPIDYDVLAMHEWWKYTTIVLFDVPTIMCLPGLFKANENQINHVHIVAGAFHTSAMAKFFSSGALRTDVIFEAHDNHVPGGEFSACYSVNERRFIFDKKRLFHDKTEYRRDKKLRYQKRRYTEID